MNIPLIVAVCTIEHGITIRAEIKVLICSGIRRGTYPLYLERTQDEASSYWDSIRIVSQRLIIKEILVVLSIKFFQLDLI